ncbi:MAG: ABC transporter permease [Thaumarchaeota archaeon]|jgi:ABC-2 type transport system permease protein|nr:ABC transporter permease [Nitrososphaerota archaeon]
MSNIAAIFRMAVWRRIKEITRYKLNFTVELIMSFIWGLGLMIFGFIIDPAKLGSIGSSNYAVFLLIGVAFQNYQGAATWGAWEIKDELTRGQIEYTFASPVSRYVYMLSSSFSQAVVGTLFGIIPMFATAFILLGSLPSPSALLMTCVSLFLTFLALCQIGVIMSSAILIFKDISAVMSILNFLFQIATGMFVPLQFMPDPIRILAFLIPITHGIDLSRHFILGTSTVWPVEVELGMLFVFIIGIGLVAKASTFYLERKAKKEGLALA